MGTRAMTRLHLPVIGNATGPQATGDALSLRLLSLWWAAGWQRRQGCTMDARLMRLTSCLLALWLLTGCSVTVPVCVPEPPHDMPPVCQPGECPPMLWGGRL